jgi:hypothetical protein
MDPAELDRMLDQELRALPRPSAPRTLLPRVMAAAAAAAEQARPVETGWSTWPRAWQAVSAAAVLICAAAAGWLIVAPPAPVANAAHAAGETVAVMRVIWDALLQPASAYLLVLGVAFAVACAAVWAAFEAALGGASSR